MTDMKLHLSNTISNTEGGKKVSAVVSNTSKAVAGGLSSAKGAFSSFITSFRQPQTDGGEENKTKEAEEAKEVPEDKEVKEAKEVEVPVQVASNHEKAIEVKEEEAPTTGIQQEIIT